MEAIPGAGHADTPLQTHTRRLAEVLEAAETELSGRELMVFTDVVVRKIRNVQDRAVMNMPLAPARAGPSSSPGEARPV